MKRISVIGFGKIGQAIAANILKQAISVTAVDINTGLQTAFKDGRYTKPMNPVLVVYLIRLIMKTG